MLDLRDELAVAVNTVICLHMACASLPRGSERAALATVSNAAREQLEEIAATPARLDPR